MDTVVANHPPLPIDQLIDDGVCVFRKLLPGATIDTLQNEVDRIRNVVFSKINAMERPLKTYSDIAEREPGRLDYRCGFTSPVFSDLAKPIEQIIRRMSPQIDFHYYWGVIPSLAGSGPTPMHRDVYPLLNTTEGDHLDALDIQLPPYYFTVLIPLMEITPQNGPTRFIKGSHRRDQVNIDQEEIYMPLLLPGDVVIFDGRTLHQGSANNSSDERIIAYLTFIANWYHDQTFKINDYLFPELSLRGR